MSIRDLFGSMDTDGDGFVTSMEKVHHFAVVWKRHEAAGAPVVLEFEPSQEVADWISYHDELADRTCASAPRSTQGAASPFGAVDERVVYYPNQRAMGSQSSLISNVAGCGSLGRWAVTVTGALAWLSSSEVRGGPWSCGCKRGCRAHAISTSRSW